jgi:hypothetical protein
MFKGMSKKSQSRQAAARDRVPNHAALTWIKGIGGSSIAIGLIGLMQDPRLFWWAVGFFYVGLAVLGVDLYYEKMPPIKKGIFWSAGFTLAAVIGIKVVFVSAPLRVEMLFFHDEQPNIRDLGGIDWRPPYSELRISIWNTSKVDYDDLNILIRPELPVADAAIVGNNYLGASIESEKPVIFVFNISGPAQPKIDKQLVLLASETGFRLRCARLLKEGGHIDIVMAILGDRDELLSKAASGFLKGAADKDFCEAWTIVSSNQLVIYGYKGADIYGPRPTNMKSVDFQGTYVAAQRIRTESLQQEITEPSEAISKPD